MNTALEAEEKAILRAISLGAGVQSTTMALMAAHGEITPMPDCAIFADTQWEPKAVYEHLEWLRSPNVLPFPVHVVTAGSLRDKVLRAGYSDVPWHTAQGMGRRQCTKVFKLYPIRNKAKELCGLAPEQRSNLKPGNIEMWVGISTDEIFRVKESSVRYIKNRHPLIERRMSRHDCAQWCVAHEYPIPPSSACRICPFLSKATWRKRAASDEWSQDLDDDDAIRFLGTGGIAQFSHPSLVPLRDVDLSTAEDRGQMNMFNNECEGMCGV